MMLYTVLYMASERTQIYLTAELRSRLRTAMARDGKSMAQVVREALETYLEPESPDPKEALASTFGSMPELSVPSRDEWDRG